MIALVSRAQAGDPWAREALAKQLKSRVDSCSRHYARRCGVDADDLRQEMWLGVFIALERVDVGIGDPLQFLLSQGRFALLTSLRKRGLPAEPAEDLDDMPAEESLERHVLDKQAALGFLCSLDETGREIVSYLLDGYSRSDAARKLGCSPANVTYHMRRVEGNLAAALGVHGERQVASAGGGG